MGSTKPTKLDLKDQFPDLYRASAKQVEEKIIPPMKFFMIDGSGNPNTGTSFQEAITTLYGAAFTLKMYFKKTPEGQDYVVPPLEGLWYMPNMAEWTMAAKEKWQWTLMIRIPDFVPSAELTQSMKLLAEKPAEKVPDLAKLRIEDYEEGLVIQILYVGPYDDEPPTIQKMHAFAHDHGYLLAGKHHEIYLSDARRVDPTKLRTILRQPVKKA